jgi:hypothetical protein
MYAQGSTTDGTYIYVFFTPAAGSQEIARLSKYDTEFNEVGTLVFTEHTTVGHGNSIAYDPVNNYIVICSSNRVVTLVSTDLDIINFYSLGNASVQSQISQIAMDDTHLVLNQSGTNNYIFYRRMNEKLFMAYATENYPQGRITKNILQDAFMYDGYIFSVSSSGNSDTFIGVFGINGCYYADYVISGLGLEFEGCFYLGGFAYFISDSGLVYRTAISNFNLHLNADAQNPSLNIQYSRFVPELYRGIASDVFKLVTIDGNFVSAKIPNVVISNYASLLNHAPERTTILGRNYFNAASVTNGSLRIPVESYDNDGHHISLWIQYTVSSSRAYQYLSQVVLVKDNTVRAVNLTDNDSEIESKLASLWDTSLTPHLNGSSKSILIYGVNSLLHSQDAFFGLIEN